MRAQILRSSVIGLIVIGALLFIPAGTLAYWQGWSFIAVYVLSSAGYVIYLARHDPALLKRRMEAGISREREKPQKLVIAFLYAACILLMVVPPLDVRFGWSHMPWPISILGDTLVLFSFYLFHLVSKANTYAAATIRVEEGQKVVSSGLYGVVRHPMYSAAIVLLVGTSMALGSWWGLLIIPLALIILHFRIENEEAVLLRDLPGYADYRRKIPYKLVPGIF